MGLESESKSHESGSKCSVADDLEIELEIINNERETDANAIAESGNVIKIDDVNLGRNDVSKNDDVNVEANDRDNDSVNVEANDVIDEDNDNYDVVVETEEKRKVSDGGWGWMIMIGCILLRIIIGGLARSSGLFYLRFLERFGGTATATSWVTSLSATVRLLSGPAVSVLCNRLSFRKLTLIGALIFVIAVHISGYATSLLYLYFTYGVLGGLGRSFLLTPLTMLLGEYFDKRRSLAFGLASTGFGIGGFTITPAIEIMFQEYGFTGTYLLLSGIACNLFVCVCLFRSPPKHENIVQKIQSESETTREANDLEIGSEVNQIDDGENEALLSFTSSTGSVHLRKANEVETDSDSNSNETKKKKSRKEKKTSSKKKLFSFSVFKDIRFVTLCMATFLFTLPSSGLFLPALAKSRGLTDIQAAGLLSIAAISDTVSRVIAGFVLDLKGIRHLRPYIYNLMSFIQCIASFCFPSLHKFEQFAAICALQGFVQGIKAAQRNVVLVDILGVDKLSSSFAVLLAFQGLGTLIGPPVSASLKDYYGKYDYPFYLSGACVFTGALILAGGNIRNYCNKSNNEDKKK